MNFKVLKYSYIKLDFLRKLTSLIESLEEHQKNGVKEFYCDSWILRLGGGMINNGECELLALQINYYLKLHIGETSFRNRR